MEDLIKKLEKIKTPEIEISSHKRKLRQVLLNQYQKEKKNWLFFSIFQKFAFASLGLVLIFFIFNNLIYPGYSLAKAKEIALKDPQIKELIEKGGEIKDVKIIKNRAYVLIQSTKEEIAQAPQISEKKALGIEKTEEVKREETSVALAEISVKEERVAKIEKIVPPVIPFSQEEKEKIQKISQNSPEIQKQIPKEAKIKEIIPPSSELKLIKRGGEIQVLPETKKEAIIIYQINKSRWQGKINLKEEKLEELKFLGEFENNATNGEKER
jgi:hypothetical protein